MQVVDAEGVMPDRDSTTATAPAGAQPLSGPASGGPTAGAAQGEHQALRCYHAACAYYSIVERLQGISRCTQTLSGVGRSLVRGTTLSMSSCH